MTKLTSLSLPAKTQSPSRRQKRGTVLVVVLGLLVVLALIGIAFAFIVQHHYNSALSALDRFRAQSAAHDGEAYAIARLRNMATHMHFEGEGDWSFQTRTLKDSHGRTANKRQHFDADGVLQDDTYDRAILRYLRNPSFNPYGSDQVVSYSRADSTSGAKGIKDGNWIDEDGDGVQGKDERRLGTDISANQMANISYFVGDGIHLRSSSSGVQSGTYRELGDRARLKIIDTCSQLNINDYNGHQLEYMLRVLGNEILYMYKEAGKLDQTLRMLNFNPFDEQASTAIARFKEINLGSIEAKSDLRAFIEYTPERRLTEEQWVVISDMIAVKSYPSSADAISGTHNRHDAERRPDLRKFMDPTRANALAGRDPFRNELGHYWGGEGDIDAREGRPDTISPGSRSYRSPFNVNTVKMPVLVAMLAGIEAEGAWLYFPDAENTATDLIENDPWSGVGQRNKRIKTDVGEQPNFGQQDDWESEERLTFGSSSDLKNLAQYQVVPVGPIGYTGEESGRNVPPPDWKEGTSAGGSNIMNPWYREDHAKRIARAIIEERETNGPFQSWQDFDYRICHQILLDFQNQVSESNADLVRTGRPDHRQSLSGMTNAIFSGTKAMFPNPNTVDHPAAGAVNSSNVAYSTEAFNAWYWRSCVDMIRANFNPNGYFNKMNPDAAMYTTVDVTDLSYQTAPMCFSSMGVYEIVSQGEVVHTGRDRLRNQAGTTDIPKARRTFRSIVQLYSVFEHTTQRDFVSPINPSAFRNTNSTSSRVDTIDSIVQHDTFGTKTHPSSISKSDFTYADFLKSDAVRSDAPIGLKDQNGRDELLTDGYFSFSAANDMRGWVTLAAQDRTPNPETQVSNNLNFHALYNVSLQATRGPNGASSGFSAGAPRTRGSLHTYGHVPETYMNDDGLQGIASNTSTWPLGLLDSMSTATPDPAASDITDASNLFRGFESASATQSSDNADRATLRPDGVLLRGWHYSPLYWKGVGMLENDRTIVGHRGVNRKSRLAILRYRCANYRNESPFIAIPADGGQDGSPNDAVVTDHISNSLEDGTARFFGPDLRLDPNTNKQAVAVPRIGARGIDWRNIRRQEARQKNTNFPYYQGMVDFAIKWDLPPQGDKESPTQAGSMDPSSMNFSGLLGATSYGRFRLNSASQGNSPINYDSLGDETDFEGSQFYIIKEPNGLIRVSHIYFTQAYTTEGSFSSVVGSSPGHRRTPSLKLMGNFDRLFGDQTLTSEQRLEDVEAGTNDIASGILPLVPGNLECAWDDPSGSVSQTDLGFSYSRTDSVHYLNKERQFGVSLVPHNWYRFTLRYRSDSAYEASNFVMPHLLYIDGKLVPNYFKHPDATTSDANLASYFGIGQNTGKVFEESDPTTPVTEIEYSSDDPNVPGTPSRLWIQRAAARSIEIDPEDKLTIGCIHRRNNYNDVLDNLKNTGIVQPLLFVADANLVVPANATIDDVRIYGNINLNLSGTSGWGNTTLFGASQYKSDSRFEELSRPQAPRPGEQSEGGIYENGFLAMQAVGDTTRPYSFPLRVGSLTWTDYRPTWSPFDNKRLDRSESDYARAPHVLIGYEIVPNILDETIPRDGTISLVQNIPSNSGMVSTNRSDINFWAAGGYDVARLNSGIPVYLPNGGGRPGNDRRIGCLKYQAFFLTPSGNSNLTVLNTTPVLDDVRMTVLTPPVRLYFERTTN